MVTAIELTDITLVQEMNNDIKFIREAIEHKFTVKQFYDAGIPLSKIYNLISNNQIPKSYLSLLHNYIFDYNLN
jgi:hypothetical protein